MNWWLQQPRDEDLSSSYIEVNPRFIEINHSIKLSITLNRKQFLLHVFFHFSSDKLAWFTFYWTRQLHATQPGRKKTLVIRVPNMGVPVYREMLATWIDTTFRHLMKRVQEYSYWCCFLQYLGLVLHYQLIRIKMRRIPVMLFHHRIRLGGFRKVSQFYREMREIRWIETM